MHILLTDILTCPRCGPQFGLILLVDAMHARRVEAGSLGCANCRERYRIDGGVADLRLGDGAAGGDGDGAVDPERLAALAGVTHGPGYLLLAGPIARRAGEVAALLDDVQVIAATSSPISIEGAENLSVLRVDEALPFYDLRIGGVVLSGACAHTLLEEGARVLSPIGRLVLEPPPADAAARVTQAGLRAVAGNAATLVAARV